MKQLSPLSWSAVLPSVPLSPGVYWFLDAAGKVLYVGKAIRLRSRLRSYTQLTKLSDRIYTLSTTATAVRYLELGSELEALLTRQSSSAPTNHHITCCLKTIRVRSIFIFPRLHFLLLQPCANGTCCNTSLLALFLVHIRAAIG